MTLGQNFNVIEQLHYNTEQLYRDVKQKIFTEILRQYFRKNLEDRYIKICVSYKNTIENEFEEDIFYCPIITFSTDKNMYVEDELEVIFSNILEKDEDLPMPVSALLMDWFVFEENNFQYREYNIERNFEEISSGKFRNKRYKRNNLAKQNITLGKLISKVNQLIVGKEYCIVDLGSNEWNGGYIYTGITEHGLYFEDIITHDGSESLSIPLKEVEIMISAGQIAEVK